jgi:hypothetical protein
MIATIFTIIAIGLVGVFLFVMTDLQDHDDDGD